MKRGGKREKAEGGQTKVRRMLGLLAEENTAGYRKEEEIGGQRRGGRKEEYGASNWERGRRKQGVKGRRSSFFRPRERKRVWTMKPKKSGDMEVRSL